VADPRFPFAVGIALLSGVVRGFSGFGSALIYIPLISAIYEPRIAAVTLLPVDFIGALWPAIQARRDANWSDLTPIAIAAIIAAPFGTMLLVIVAPTTLRWVISATVLFLLAVLVSGWQYRGQPSLALKLAVGMLAGLGQGATQIGGPLLIIYWLSTAVPVVVRANLLVYFQLVGVIFMITYVWQGVFDANGIGLALLLGPPFFAAIALGVYSFRAASALLYRRIAYAIVAVAALVSLPLFDSILQ
jgi:uncharacterized membrane protein YfcA